MPGPGHQEPPSGMQGPTCLADVNEAPPRPSAAAKLESLLRLML